MPKKRFSVEQIISHLREAEVFLAQGQTIGQVCRHIGISEQSYYRWHREYGGLKVDQARRLRSDDVLHLLADLFADRGPSDHIRSDNGPAFTAKVRQSLARQDRREDPVHRTRQPLGERIQASPLTESSATSF